MRDNADVMIWTHGATPEKLQAAVRKIRRTALFAGTTIVWSTMGVHREAEFTRNHAPAYARGKAPEAWVCVYPLRTLLRLVLHEPRTAAQKCSRTTA